MAKTLKLVQKILRDTAVLLFNGVLLLASLGIGTLVTSRIMEFFGRME